MVDDHSLILEGYKSILLDPKNTEGYQLFIETANDADEALKHIENSLLQGAYDIVFLDINIPPSSDNKILSGEDLGKEIKKVSPSTSLIVLTMYSENLRLISILKNLDPDAFLIKSDILPIEFIEAFKKVLQGKVYYSQTISEMMRRKLTSDIVLTENDRSILFYLADGVRTKDLVGKVPLSLAAIEKRKKLMKEIFEVPKDGDIALINQARKLGFI